MADKSPQKMDADYFRKNFNTPLSSLEEQSFNKWLQMQSKIRGRDMSKDLNDYDLRGYWKNEIHLNTPHFTDKYKKPNHPTFSTESIYHASQAPYPDEFVPEVDSTWHSKWAGGGWGGGNPPTYFQPSELMLKRRTHNLVDLAEYLRQNEPGVRLKMPGGVGGGADDLEEAAAPWLGNKPRGPY